MADVSKSTEPSCPQCMGVFKDPRILNCYHTFCLECLKTFTAPKNSRNCGSCPICLTEFVIPETGVTSIAINKYILRERGSLIKQTTIYMCDVCNVDTDAQVYCLQCDQDFCEPCMNIHQKMKLLSDHTLVPMSKKESMKKTRIVFCRRHTFEQLRFICLKCDLPICLHCKLTDHENHTTENLDEVAEKTRRQMREIFADEYIDSKISPIIGRKRTLKITRSKLIDMKKREIDCIYDRAQDLQKKVCLASDNFIKEVESYFEEEERKVEKEEVDIKRNVQSIHSLKTTGAYMMNSANDAEIVQNGRILHSKMVETVEMSETMAATAYVPRFSFQSKDVDLNSMQELFGTVRRGGFSEKSSLLSTFTTKSSDWIYGLSTTNSGKCWVSTGDQTVILLDSRGRVLKKLHVGMNNLYLSGDNKGNVFISCYYDNSIHILTQSGDLKKFATLPFGPRGLSVNYETGDVIVCSDDALYKLTQSADVSKMVLTADIHFAVAVDVAVNKKGDMCVSDRRQNSLFIFTSNNQLRSSYKGTVSSSPFDPCGVCCDDAGNFVVADFTSKLIQIINNNGKLLETFSTAGYCDGNPFSVSVDTIGRLWIGFNNGKVCVLGHGE